MLNRKAMQSRVRSGFAAVRRLARAYLREHNSPFALQWEALFRRTPMHRVHLAGAQVAWPYYPAWGRRFLLAAALVSWPFRALYLVYLYSRAHGRRFEAAAGKGPFRQAVQQLGLALRYSVPPMDYYLYAFYSRNRRAEVERYLHEYEVIHLFSFINRYREDERIHDKKRFAETCAQAGLPVVPLIAEARQGRVRFVEPYAGLPSADLFVKPRFGSKGHGASRWVATDSGSLIGPLGFILTPEAFLEHVGLLSAGADYLIQPRLFPHSDVRDLSGNALPAARIVTGRSLRGDVTPLRAVFKMPTGSMMTDFSEGGGLISPIDIGTGELGSAVRLALDPTVFETHPDSGAPITGRRLSDWQEAVQWVCRAHLLFEDVPFLGWDVALTPAGPVLLEGNLYWSVRLMQRAHFEPLGASAFPEICLAHLENVMRNPPGRLPNGRRLHFFTWGWPRART